MIGIIQKVLLDLLEKTGGETLKRAVIARAGLDQNISFRIDQNYSDQECLQLIQATAEETGLSDKQINTLYAEAFIDEAMSLFPRFFSIARNSEEFLKRQATIHAVMASGLKHSADRKQVTDKFVATPIAPGEMYIDYRSPNRLCGIFTALAYEVAKRYGDDLNVSCDTCAKRGEDSCRFLLQWPELQGAQVQTVRVGESEP